jgi:hypothetical protein
MLKVILNQRELLKQLDVHNLSWCYAVVFGLWVMYRV